MIQRTISPERESFRISEQSQNLNDLKLVSEINHSSAEHEEKDDTVLLIERVVKHCESYYAAKSRWAEIDVLTMFSPPWRSSLEHSFLWVGGWRPSMAFHLLYSKTGLQVETQLAVLMQRLSTGDLSDLSHSQLGMLDRLQRKTIKQEIHITHKMAKLQETLADTTMTGLSHTATEMMRTNDHELDEDHEEQVESTLISKEKYLEKILQRADELRLRTIKDITHILTPIQAVHFLIAAAELHSRLHDWGKNEELLWPTG